MELGRPIYESLRVVVRGESDAGHARREFRKVVEGLGWSEEDCGRLAIVVTEAATNLFLHGGGGDIVLRQCVRQQGAVEMLALDRGVGMANVDRCMEDGYSTAGSRGAGMGSMRRLADHFEVYSQPQKGAAIFARLAPKGSVLPASRVDYGVVCVALDGEPVAGDAWSFCEAQDGCAVAVIDGLGHGALAAKAAQVGTQVMQQATPGNPERILAEMHEAMRVTRGAAVAIADVQWEPGNLRFAGVGNISGALFVSPSNRHGCVSYNGIVGEGAPRMRAFDYGFAGPALLILASDGLSSRWDMDSYAGLFARHPALIAGVLFRDFARGRDDATVFVLRARPVKPA